MKNYTVRLSLFPEGSGKGVSRVLPSEIIEGDEKALNVYLNDIIQEIEHTQRMGKQRAILKAMDLLDEAMQLLNGTEPERAILEATHLLNEAIGVLNEA
jgi:hypothetical protein